MQHIYRIKAALRLFTGLFVVFLGLCLTPTYAQQTKRKKINRAKLEAEKQANIRKISELNAIIAKTEQKKEVSVGKLNALGERINKQSKQISLLTENQELLDMEVSELTRTSGQLSGNLEKLKQEYAKMVFNAAKVSNKYNQLSFLFSAPSFNKLVKRYKYLRQYSEARTRQAALIENVREELRLEQLKILQKRQDQANVLKEKIQETQKLETLKVTQTDVVAQLSQKEQKLKEQLDANKKAVEKLENMIAQMVEREIKRSQQRIRNKENESGVTERKASIKTIELSPEERKIATSFSQLRGRMPWPVQSGFISDRFGVHNHPVLRGVKLNNDGIDIQTSSGNSVYAVYDGIVRSVVNIPGVNTIVAIQHGDYFTVYGKLSNVVVHEGQSVSSSQKIGQVATDSDGTSEVKFQVWKNNAKQNPEAWLRNR